MDDFPMYFTVPIPTGQNRHYRYIYTKVLFPLYCHLAPSLRQHKFFFFFDIYQWDHIFNLERTGEKALLLNTELSNCLRANNISGLKLHIVFKKTKGCSPYLQCMYVPSENFCPAGVCALLHEINFDQVITLKLLMLSSEQYTFRSFTDVMLVFLAIAFSKIPAISWQFSAMDFSVTRMAVNPVSENWTIKRWTITP